MSNTSVWNGDLDRRLIQLVNSDVCPTYAGMASTLTAEFGVIVSIGAVAGKIRRLGLSKRAQSQLAAQVKTVSVSKRAPEASDKVMVSIAPQKYVDKPTPPGLVTFEGLLKHHCRFPSGASPAITFCGCPREKGSPYCADHKKAAYYVQPSRVTGWV